MRAPAIWAALPSAIAVLAVGSLLLTSGCSAGRPPVEPSRPAAWLVPGFDDLPLPELVGYQPESGTTPLAASFAAGHLRRFDVRFEPRDGTVEEPPQTALDRLASAMAALGWTRQSADSTLGTDGRPTRPTAKIGRFTKDDELAVITCVPDGSSSRIHVLVRPLGRD